ncbi:MAG TPA: glycosyltransferase family 4 protein [Vicinamibacterales bacterium]|nr:glycosyltransferase family 4 protein [Vicinamibacterales bacterium]
MTRPWLLVSGDFSRFGGMDCANHALALHLLSTGREVHLVTHRADDDLAKRGAIVHRARRPFGSHALGMPFLASAGRHRARQLARRRARVICNGGNCAWRGVNWVHFLHAAAAGATPAAGAQRLLADAQRAYVLRHERDAITRSAAVVCNSERTKRDVQEQLGVDAGRVSVIYYGIDAARFGPIRAEQRQQARAALGMDALKPAALFIGALGDRRKGFDLLFDAWRALCQDDRWDVDLIVAGHGRELPAWRRRAGTASLDRRMRFLGFRRDVETLLAAADVVVHPARYEAYGLGVHEGLCRGVPAIVTSHAGVAERYPEALRPLLLRSLSADALMDRLRAWRDDTEGWRARTAPLGAALRARTWDVMSEEIAERAERDE